MDRHICGINLDFSSQQLIISHNDMIKKKIKSLNKITNCLDS